jgi:hypothetical protein
MDRSKCRTRKLADNRGMDRDTLFARWMVGGGFMERNNQHDCRLVYDGFMDLKHFSTSELVNG